MKINALILGAALALCAGCETMSRKTAGATTPSPPPPAPKVAPVAGTDLDQSNLEKVRVGETLRSYPVSRYIDPSDPNVMHEAHVVYRKEAGASWNLNPNAPTIVPLGPVLAVADPAKTPDPLPSELESKMAEQNQLVASLIEQNEALTKQLAQLNQDVAALRQKQTTAKEGDK
mgnify:CR=1 FL=1